MKLGKFLGAASVAGLLCAPVAQASDIVALVDAANDRLAQMGADYYISKVETLADGESGEMGQTILFKDVGNKQLGSDWVPGDPRRGGRTDITYRTDGTEPSTDAVDTFGAIDSAMSTWDDETCSAIPITDLGDTGADIGFVQSLVPGFGGNPYILEPLVAGADISHAGVLPGAWFDAFFGTNSILGVAFTLVFFDDLDGDGRGDTAYKEIYYNDGFTWTNNPDDAPGDGLVDFESVALHEAGHGLSQAHFGSAAIVQNGNIRISPDAVMNAGYIFARQDLQSSDRGGHCSNWGSWPNN